VSGGAPPINGNADAEHDLLPLYRTWFMQRLPTGERLGIDISPQLEESFKALDTSPGANN
jgi:glutamate/aspartate transport system substrate-binding protein